MKTVPVSVIIPTYNAQNCIMAALDSIFNQLASPAEIIIVDDCSSDQTINIVNQNLNSNKQIPIKFIKLDTNSGSPAKPLNVGISAASQELIAILEQDDLFLANKIELQANFLLANSDLVLVGGLIRNFIKITDEIKEIEPSKLPDELQKQIVSGYAIIEENLALELLIRHGMFLTGYPGFMFRKSAWQKLGKINEDLSYCGDFDLVLKLAQLGKIALGSDYVYKKTIHTQNLSNQRANIILEAFQIKTNLVLKHSFLAKNQQIRSFLTSDIFSCLYWFREAGLLQKSLSILKIWRQSGAPLLSCIKQLSLLFIRKFLIILRISKPKRSGYVKAPHL